MGLARDRATRCGVAALALERAQDRPRASPGNRVRAVSAAFVLLFRPAAHAPRRTLCRRWPQSYARPAGLGQANGDRIYLDEDVPRSNPARPTMLAAIPPISIQIALFVGEPVKKRETSELNELLEFTAKTINTIPPASSATEISLFTTLLASRQHPGLCLPQTPMRANPTAPRNMVL